jgi:hypothetical protein
VDTVVEVHELVPETVAVCFPGHPVHTRRCLLPQPAVGRPQQFDIDMVQQSGEPFTLLFLCCLPYATQPVGHAFPARCPAHAVLDRVPLGPRPWLHRLRGQSPVFVRRLHSYYGEV